ncbi:hypothetical protein IPM62_02505 [Candidatus Woesebacteria bacterium]|nr:MAG: hypothetical protein IPM62_02505 [Candidatus Woesebacteria bacterium]
MTTLKKLIFTSLIMLVFVYLCVLTLGMYVLKKDVDLLKHTKPYKNVGNLISWQESNSEDFSQATDSGKIGITEITRNSQDNRFSIKDCVDCNEAILEMIDSAESNNTVSVVDAPNVKTQTSYIPLGSSAGSTSTNWFTINDASSYIDLKNDFNMDAYVTFEASLKVLHGNGQAFARLWDDTNKIAVTGSEISTSNNADFQHVKSTRIYLWNGNNNYKVQIKSLNGYEVTISDSKVKIVY